MLVIGVVVALGVVGCGKSAEKPTTGSGAPKHGPGRVKEFVCPSERPPGDARPGVGGLCAKDADCQTGSNGRCQTLGSRMQENRCTYDACFHDADCKIGGPCECQSTGNVCLQGNCRIDADCGAGGSCARSNSMSCGGGEPAYFCRTADDTCTDECGDHKQCVYLQELGHWGCKAYPDCPVG
jgi:hypothetical protein